MKYKYIPNTIDFRLIDKIGLSYEEFLKLQIIYRKSLESILKKYINFKNLDLKVKELNINVPILNDFDYNFYHKYSSLESNYLFLRNNIHIERLSNNEIAYIKSCLQSNNEIKEEFILKTLENVIFEEGEETFFEIPNDNNRAKSRSIVLEFAYDDKECEVEESYIISQFCEKMFEKVKRIIESKLNIPISCLINDGFSTELYLSQNNNELLI